METKRDRDETKTAQTERKSVTICCFTTDGLAMTKTVVGFGNDSDGSSCEDVCLDGA